MKTGNGRQRQLGVWLLAARPRTLILAVACVGMGVLLASADGVFAPLIAGLTIVTAALLQILSNLANDYGDSVHGADHEERLGPSRTVQSGQISAGVMKRAIGLLVGVTALVGIGLLWLALGAAGIVIMVAFLSVGALAIWAAITYTAGRLPYGYAGLGDLAVFLFFGWVAVLGSYYLQALDLGLDLLLPGTSCGLFAVAVLNVNNIRDIDSDRLAGKRSVPARIGLRRARMYHWSLLTVGMLAAVAYVLADYSSAWQWLFLLTAPMFILNGRAVSRLPPAELDPLLGQMSMSTLLFVVCFGIGQLLA
ncbi:MAG: 1,4-dihydroxy-2-naphthoate polyprenyltransferase [Chloroflexota bacterium]|nr:MAG: 1,4-dihydroxy-2-naphthoate polyprenyltransferase [Chloroflexota bacterium]